MYKFLFVAFVFLFVSAPISQAGRLVFEKDFFEYELRRFGFDSIECPDSFVDSRDTNYLCATVTTRLLNLVNYAEVENYFAKTWEEKFPTESSKFNYKYEVIQNWSNIKTGKFLKFKFNDKTAIVTIYDWPDEKVVVISLDAKDDVLSKNPPKTQTSTNSSNKPTLSVLRWRCEPSQNGYARVYGTVKNTSPITFEYLQFTVEFFNGSDFVGQESGYVKADKLEPDRETTFDRLVKMGPYSRCVISFEGKDGKLAVQLP
jgi:hypothetical protein